MSKDKPVTILPDGGPDVTSAGVNWNEVPEFARHHVAWIDGRHGSAPRAAGRKASRGPSGVDPHGPLDLELADGAVIADTVGDKPCIFLAGLYRAERGIAERLLQLRTGKLPWPWIDPDKAIPWIEQRTGLVLAQSQRSAVALALRSKVLVITGGPGVGKTTLVNAILRILSAKGVRLLLCAPTGRAASA